MTRAVRFCLMSVAATVLFGCGMVSDVTETKTKSDAVAVALEKAIGVKPLVGWKIQNGTLTQVNVQFPVDGVAKLPVGELVNTVRVVVTESFDKPPQQLVVSTFSQQ